MASATVRPEQEITTMATRRGYQMGRCLAGRLMKELGLVRCQQPTHRYKRGGHRVGSLAAAACHGLILPL